MKLKRILRSSVSRGTMILDQAEKHVELLDKLEAERVQQDEPPTISRGRPKRHPKG
jgi:hypothetical protein